ncbi:MAG: 3-phosphoshikimate 1-carboxyvinyltransferase [bacterium]
MAQITIKKIKRLEGSFSLSGDKSISHRAVLLGSIADGKTRIKNFSQAKDCLSTVKCMQKLGSKIEFIENDELVIENNGLLKESQDILDAENSGTTIRLLSGILSSYNFFSVFTGDDSLKQRPMKRIIEPLILMGANIWARENNFLPLAIKGKDLKAISYQSSISSAQIKSCVLLAGLRAEGITTYSEPIKSRDHTEKMLKSFGANITINENTISLQGNNILKSNEIIVPGDISTAAFFIIAASILEGSHLIIENVGINPTRMGIIKILQKSGAKINLFNQRILNEELIADIEIHSCELDGFSIDEKLVPSLIDEIPILSIAAIFSQKSTVIKGAEELRVKETDRIKSISTNLKKLGIEVEEFSDGMIIHPQEIIKVNVVVDSFKDHRIAMSMIIAGLKAQKEIKLIDPECIEISCPNFLEILEKVSVR